VPHEAIFTNQMIEGEGDVFWSKIRRSVSATNLKSSDRSLIEVAFTSVSTQFIYTKSHEGDISKQGRTKATSQNKIT
jgi:hypothetical protein